MTQLTERQAWLTIAEAFATDKGERTSFQKNLTVEGCCWALFVLRWGEHTLGSVVYYTMTNKITDCLLPRCKWFCRPYPKFDHLRAGFCYLMAYACEEE